VNSWLGTLKQARHRIVICGNHEANSATHSVAKVAAQLSNAHYLSDSGIVISTLIDLLL
jgi:hypothetical protein